MREKKEGVDCYYAKSRQAWRSWLQKNHAREKSVWLIIYKKESEVPSVYYPEAVDEALCFGWIDSKPNKRDADSYYQFFARRNPKSNWSAVNKRKVEKLIELGLMTEAGMEMVLLAKEKGTWDALKKVDELETPDDLMKLLKKDKLALTNWTSFSRSTKRGMLEWILSAKKTETRKARVERITQMARLNDKNLYSMKQ